MTPAVPAGVRDDVRAWIGEHWEPELSLVDWRGRLVDSGWGTPSWPRDWYGRGLPSWAEEVVAEELAAGGAPGMASGVGMVLAAATILEHGSDDLKRRLLRLSATGEATWCQLFSEPGAGSDLAGVTSHAVRDGDTWIVNGQKVWNTSAHHADYGLLVARTDWDVPKHRGLTYFVIPMYQPGVDVRPLRQMNGYASFNEVFLDDAEVPADNIIGDIGGGWPVALTTLAHERHLARDISGTRSAVGSSPRSGRAWQEAAEERAIAMEPYTWYPQRAGRVDLLVERAVAAGRSADPVVRQEVARVLTLARVAGWTSQRAAASRALGRPPGAEGSIGKLATSNIARASARTHSLIAGAGGMCTGADSPLDGVITEILVSVPAVSIAGGTDEIQHNILAERILGLPKEPDASRDLPFRDVPKNPKKPSKLEA